MIRKGVALLGAKLKGPLADIVFNLLLRSPGEGAGRAPFSGEELRLLRQALASQNLSCIEGEMVPAFETEFAYAYGVPHAVASTSGTAAIHVALGALDLNPGDEVITAPITDIGTIIPILYQNAIPVFADVDASGNIDPASVEHRITARTKAVLAVHLFGNPCEMDALSEITRRRGIALIEDCSQAHMAEYKGRLVGTIGEIGCFSFQQSKHMTTGDGGMTITSRPDYYHRMKLFVDKAYVRNGPGARSYLFHAPNYRMNELTGAVGRAQLRKLPQVVQKRRELSAYLTHLLADVPGITPLPTTPGAKPSPWLYPMEISGMEGKTLADRLIQEKIWASAGYIGKPIYLCSEALQSQRAYGTSNWPFGCHGDPERYRYEEGLCPEAESLLSRLVCLPMDEGWERSMVERVAQVARRSVQGVDIRTAPVSVVRSTPASPAPARTEERMPVGIIGCGQMGRWHLESYLQNPHVAVVAVADTDLEKANALAAAAGAKAYRSHTEMLQAHALRGVSICTIPTSHRAIAIDALRAGVNVLCEKPLTVSVADADAMQRVADEQNCLLMTAFKFRFFEEVLKAREILSNGGLGEIVNFRLTFGGSMDMAGSWYADPKLSGGGVLMDNGPHAFDLVSFLMGPIGKVSAQTRTLQGLDVEDTAQIQVCLADGTSGVIELSWCLSIPPKQYLEIYGRNGTLLLDGRGLRYRFQAWKEWAEIPNRLDAKQAFSRQVRYFTDAVGGNNPQGLGQGEGLAAQRVIEAAYRSARDGRTAPDAAASLPLPGGFPLRPRIMDEFRDSR